MSSNPITTIPTPFGAGFAMPSAVLAQREHKAGGAGVVADRPAACTPGTQVWSPPT